MSKAKFIDHGTAVTLEYTDECDVRQSRTFLSRGRYVWESIGFHGREQQVCDRLENRGNTLMIRETQNLIDIIRREYRAMRSAEQRRARRDNPYGL